MSKIICDVCGTAYPETASQCPICGCAKPEDVQASADGESTQGRSTASSYTYVKGGRYSRANVRKRNRGKTEQYRTQKAPASGGKSEDSNLGLTIAVIVLLLSILALVFYIGYHFFWEGGSSGNNSTTSGTLSDSTTSPDDQQIPCTDLILESVVIELDGAGRSWLLNAIPEPADTTDTITYLSGDESVATVSDTGKVTAVGPGQTVITILCGDVEKECRVVCEFDTDPSDPTEPSDDPTEPSDDPTEPSTAPAPSGEDYTIHVYYGTSPYYNKETQTVEAMINVGDTFPLNIRDSSGNYVDVTWTASNGCCTVTGNTVKGVSSGTVNITTIYDGITFTCRVIVN